MVEVICFSAGGTLGHINPALTLIKILKEKKTNLKIIFIMTKKEERYNFIKDNPYIDKIIYCDVDGFNRKKLFRNFKNIFKISSTLMIIKKVLKKEKVQKVIGMGGYISALTITVSKCLGLKTIIHEQNMVMGLANKMVFKKVDLVLGAFPIGGNVRYVGNPRMLEAHKYQQNLLTTNHIVVSSGTLGSQKINEVMMDFLKSEVSHKYYTTLITGKRYYDEVVKILGSAKEHYRIIPFDENLITTLSTANLIISRSGATSIFEIIGLQKPSILIPSPNVTGNHQYYNAHYLEEQEGAFLLKEEYLNVDMLSKTIENVINNPVYIDNLKKLYHKLEKVSWLEVLDV